ncbi:hypothetical protein BZA70DRAFT_276036 [Myxozyma melibiosi]|uniref:Uncharacterized protein n=1 Tax=Myxozyma melibiosi TaxID=54550 RepID=A0ABR1F8Q1_9ASCO
MPFIRRYLRLTEHQTILVRAHVADASEIAYFCGPASVQTSSATRLHSVIEAVKPLVFMRLRDTTAGAGKMGAGDMANAIRGDERQRQLTLDGLSRGSGGDENGGGDGERESEGVKYELGRVEGGKGDYVTNRKEGWACKMFLRNDESTSRLIMKELKVASQKRRPRQKRSSRKRRIIDLDGEGDGNEVGEEDGDGGQQEGEEVSASSEEDEEDEEDMKPQMTTDYKQYAIYGRVLILLLKKTATGMEAEMDKLLWGSESDRSDGDEDDGGDDEKQQSGSTKPKEEGKATRAGMSAWIGASQQMRVEETAMDFEEK